MTTITQDLLTSIANGDHDMELDSLINTIHKRQSMLRSLVAEELVVGQSARFSDEIRPKYLAGLEVTVVRKNRESVAVDCPADPRYGRFSGARGVRCSNGLIVPA